MAGFATYTLQSAATGTGNGTSAAVYGQAALVAQVTGITSATITWEGTVDGTNWVSLRASLLGTGATATTATANGVYRLDVSGLHDVRARISTYSSGTITVVAESLTSAHSARDVQVTGPAASGASSSGAGNPVMLGARDGSNTVRYVLVDTGGQLQIVGAAASGAAVSGNPLLQGVSDGATVAIPRTPTVFKTVTAQAITAGTGITIWDPASGKKFRLMGYVFSSTAAASLKFYEGLTTALTNLRFQGPLLAANGVDVCPPLGNGLLSGTVDMNLNLDSSVNTTVSGTVWGTEE